MAAECVNVLTLSAVSKPIMLQEIQQAQTEDATLQYIFNALKEYGEASSINSYLPLSMDITNSHCKWLHIILNLRIYYGIVLQYFILFSSLYFLISSPVDCGQ